ncbi:MAG: ABC-F family ATP-binding cassette domain-containing protein [Chloroflexi bacterium]|nr:ABC-F family ATP-binding cassette domain-containing protein [Chloroflexota bacterium]MBT4003579.1 ABC-F family ATP-binding cassette domain-containing protein [Chloroflexota bacterium]MBT4305059.1 ABC-F family ATP-binding cassette domain-containing protein [Chloroflexota bacterium]MBT5337572.1 ABC-F family ATP-binding cassette domain-containing protein [Chloroflexota bacterium]MBT6150835.1 ABC-F family ATP-binding cassette domain-containing protein [Chloroflexota bacterium]
MSVKYATDPIFEELSWEIHNDRCVGLVGINGSGKSTLLHLIDGSLKSETGFINLASGLKVGVLQQEPQLTPGNSVIQEALSASPELKEVEKALAKVENRLGLEEVYGDEKTLTRAIAEQEKYLKKFEALGGNNYESRVRSTLLGMGIKEEEFELDVDSLSGGQKKLVGLAKLLVTQPDLLLLDEPDNHLDLAGKTFLEKFIRNFKGGVVIISHDRYLLDVVADEIAELENGKITVYKGNYSEYSFEKEVRLIRQQEVFQAQQKEITRLETSAKRLLTWGHIHDNEKFVKRGKNILKRIDRIERIDKPITDRRKMDLSIAGWRGSNKVLEFEKISKSFEMQNGENRKILDGIDFDLWHGERVGLVGPNGAGKSVLFQLILGKLLAEGGEIKIGPSIKTGYYAQEHETLDYSSTLIETIRQAAPLTEEKAVSFLGKFLFSYEQDRGPVSNLSGGERSRLQMALLMLTGVNFLLLDEPTNNLDIASAEVLEEALEEFEGSVLVISHDRYFLDRVVGRIIELDQGKVKNYLGGFSDYLEEKNRK